MAKKSENDKNIIEGLNSEKESVIINTIKNLYSSGSVDVLPHLLKLFFLYPGELVRVEILGVINNLKDQKASVFLVEAVKKYKGQKNYNELISACWQNGLDFSDDINIFVDLVIEADLPTAIEAFSVVEGNISEISDQDRNNIAKYVKSKINIAVDVKKDLIRELHSIVEFNH